MNERDRITLFCKEHNLEIEFLDCEVDSHCGTNYPTLAEHWNLSLKDGSYYETSTTEYSMSDAIDKMLKEVDFEHHLSGTPIKLGMTSAFARYDL